VEEERARALLARLERQAAVADLRPALALAAGAGIELDDAELKALTRAVKDSLRAGIARQGASLRDYSAPNGRRGRMQRAFNVYGRTGEPCERCGSPVDKIRVAGRGTWYCPECQRLDARSDYAAMRSSRRPSRSSRHSSV
jgi:formamidopyrimidine-DNA glycosylase